MCMVALLSVSWILNPQYDSWISDPVTEGTSASALTGETLNSIKCHLVQHMHHFLFNGSLITICKILKVFVMLSSMDIFIFTPDMAFHKLYLLDNA